MTKDFKKIAPKNSHQPTPVHVPDFIKAGNNYKFKPKFSQQLRQNHAKKSFNFQSSQNQSDSNQSLFDKIPVYTQKTLQLLGQLAMNLAENRFFQYLILVLGAVFFWVIPIFNFAKAQAIYFWKWVNIADNLVRFSFGVLFFVMIFNLFSLQVLGNGPLGSGVKNNKVTATATTVIPAKKGNIYIEQQYQVQCNL
jgi:hypothetical protein